MFFREPLSSFLHDGVIADVLHKGTCKYIAHLFISCKHEVSVKSVANEVNAEPKPNASSS